MGAMNNLQKDRHGTFYVRMVVPQSLRPVLRKGELKRSLQTKDWREANTRAPDVLKEFQELLVAARMDASVSEQDLINTVTRWSSWVLAHIEESDIKDSFIRQEWDGDESYYTDNTGEVVSLLDDLGHAQTPEHQRQVLRNLCELLRNPLDAALQLSGMRLLDTSSHYCSLVVLLGKEYLKLSELVSHNIMVNAQQRRRGQPEITLVPPNSQAAFRYTSTKKTLSVLFTDYQTALIRRDPKKAKARIAEYTPAVERFIELLGDKPIDTITKRDVAEFRNLLEQLPSRPKQSIATLPLRQQMAVTQDQHLPRLNLATVKKLIRGLSAVLAQAVDDGLLEHNPVHGVKVQVPTPVTTDDAEPAFRPNEIVAIFNSPLFLQRRGPTRANFGEAPYWVPLMLYYTGARVEEICQLYVTDIRQEQGIWFIHIAEQRSDQRVKNLSSNRDVPIHSHLIELGFLEYVQRLPTDGRLFPHLTASGPKESYHARLGVWWGNYLRETIQLTRSGISRFHSFRHTFMTHCRTLSLREDVQNAITGHSQHTDRTHTGRDYGVYTLAVKHDAIERIPKLGLIKVESA